MNNVHCWEHNHWPNFGTWKHLSLRSDSLSKPSTAELRFSRSGLWASCKLFTTSPINSSTGRSLIQSDSDASRSSISAYFPGLGPRKFEDVLPGPCPTYDAKLPIKLCTLPVRPLKYLSSPWSNLRCSPVQNSIFLVSCPIESSMVLNT